MKKSVTGNLVHLDGELFYKIENFDEMADFFMTITSPSDVWNFCWAQGGITAGRKNADHAIFPYYTCDKIQDAKGSTGSVTIIKIKSEGKKGIIWQPFENLLSSTSSRYSEKIGIQRNLYKSLNGNKIWFEEINLMLALSFRYAWTSSEKFGLVKITRIENLSDRKVNLEILDGCQNIMPSSADSTIQNNKSVLLDAYKKTEVEPESNIALFTLSSLVTDKAEPGESLRTNVCYFTTKDPLIISDQAIPLFVSGESEFLQAQKKELNGKRGQCFIIHQSILGEKEAECWEQVFDIDYDASKLVELKSQITNREEAWKFLAEDMKKTEEALEAKIAAADGIQTSGNEIADLHHRTNVMFNIMRGGIFANKGNILIKDFIDFTRKRDKKIAGEIQAIIQKNGIEMDASLPRQKIQNLFFNSGNPYFKRLFLEYLPLTFSRRHGDPSRPWNRFNINLKEEDGSEKIDYEGNWRDIFQNWEALLWSYPEYAANVCSIFVNAMTVEGYNPYRISREGLDWEVPEEGNPWAQFGYWGDHQVIYLQKILEFLYNYDSDSLLSLMNEKIFSTAALPYRIKNYDEILKNPRNSLVFDFKLDKILREREKSYGTDARCILTEQGTVQLTTLATKLIQLILAKALSFIPDGGIWMNTQRPEWNDANNALAGYGTSVVTLFYLERMLSFLIKILDKSDKIFLVSTTVADTLFSAVKIYKNLKSKAKNGITDSERKSFTDKTGLLFESERKTLYENGFSEDCTEIPAKRIAQCLKAFEDCMKKSIEANKRDDGLFHAYNSLIITDDKIQVIHLKLMLEGQVAALSCNLLTKNEKRTLLEKMRESELFEENQHSYMLYPNSTLPNFLEKNTLTASDIAGLEDFIKRSGNSALIKDIEGKYHFNPDFQNAECMKKQLESLGERERPQEYEKERLLSLYEKTFKHNSFTGRSGTFYAYEGLGCIYWHMVSKLLLAVQENITGAKDGFLFFYKDIKKGLGSSKTPEEYGAFPFDPYSHTPFKQGARQPGMTGQVKEEIICRWKELGLGIENGKAVFNPTYLEKKDFDEKNQIHFTWCGTPISYSLGKAQNPQKNLSVSLADGSERSYKGYTLPKEESALLFARSGKIREIRLFL